MESTHLSKESGDFQLNPEKQSSVNCGLYPRLSIWMFVQNFCEKNSVCTKDGLRAYMRRYARILHPPEGRIEPNNSRNGAAKPKARTAMSGKRRDILFLN